jgi:hypothetical protein
VPNKKVSDTTMAARAEHGMFEHESLIRNDLWKKNIMIKGYNRKNIFSTENSDIMQDQRPDLCGQSL